MSKSHKKGDPRFPTGSSQQGGATSMSSKQSKKAEAQKRKHWSMRSQETLISRNRDGHFCLNVEGGAEHGLFTFVGDIRQDRIHYQRGKVHPGDLILAVNHKRVPGMIKKDVIALIKRSSDPVSLISVRQSKLQEFWCIVFFFVFTRWSCYNHSGGSPNITHQFIFSVCISQG